MAVKAVPAVAEAEEGTEPPVFQTPVGREPNMTGEDTMRLGVMKIPLRQSSEFFQDS
jgi:hypothetical protein